MSAISLKFTRFLNRILLFSAACVLLLFGVSSPILAQGSWTFTGSMNTPRTGATGTRLTDGRVLVAGGVDAVGNFLSSAEIYDPAVGTWAFTSPMVQPQSGAVAVLLHDGRVLVYGGNIAGGSGGVTSLAQIFDLATGLWTSTGAMNQCRQSFTGTLLANGQALAVGGYCGGYLSSVEIYDPSTGTWTFTGSLPAPVANASATLLQNGKVLATGGTTGSAAATTELYDPSSGSWTVTGSLNQARAWGDSYDSSGTIRLNSGQVLAVGGVGGSGCGSFLSSAELYDPTAGTWTFTGSLATTLDQHRLVLLSDGRALATGGLANTNNCTTYLNTAQIYDPGSGAWTSAASLNQARAQQAAASLLDGRVLVAGGNDQSITLNTAEIFSLRISTSTALSSSVNPSVFGQSITFTATVNPSSGSGTPTGTLTLSDGGTMLASEPSSGGQLTFSTTTLAVGSHSITVAYGGDSNFSPSTSTSLTQTVNQASTATSISSSPNPAVAGQPVTFTATVLPISPGGGTPTGTVMFTDGTTTLGSTPLSSGKATLTVPSLSPGSHSIGGQYSGDGNFGSSSTAGAGGGGVNQTIGKATTTTTVSSSANPSILNQSVTLTARISVVAPGSGTPTGTVTFQDGATNLGAVGLSGSGTATFTPSSFIVASHSVTASYSGDANFNGSSGNVTQQVTYGICALYDQTRSVKSGAPYPIRLELCDANATDASAAAIVLNAVQITNVSGFSGAPETVGNANPDLDFRFDSTLGTTGGYIFNLSTSGLASGTYMLLFKATNDPVTHSVNFGVK